MADQETQGKSYPLKYKGLVTKLDPALLTDGQMQVALNTVSVQEGNISIRAGRKLLGVMSAGLTNPHKIAKLSIPNQPVPVSNATNATPIVITTAIPHGWLNGFGVTIRGVTGNTAANGSWVISSVSASSFTLLTSVGNGGYVNGGEASLFVGDAGIRYVGEKDDIYRTLDNYSTFTRVTAPNGINGSRNIFPNRWSMAPYSAGATANPYAYFACPGAMVKDQGNTPFTPLRKWGITPGLAAASASNATGTTVAIAGITLAAPMVVNAIAHSFTTAQQVFISGVTGSIEANGAWTITVIDADHFSLNNSVGAVAYISGGIATLLGPDSSLPGASSYNYVYTYRNTATNNEGNPSTLMDPSLYVDSTNGLITVTVWGSPDTAQITGPQSIAIYRQGGSFSDGIYRLVGYATNPGVDGSGVPLSATFVDTTPDSSLLFATQAEFDNFPPVVSTLRYPVNATISSMSPGTFPGWNTVTLSLPVNNIVLPGTQVTLGSVSSGTTNNQEIVLAAATPQPSTGADTTLLLYMQLKHVTGEPVLIDAIVGQPCSLAISAFDSILLAGDENNPHVLYKSKTGRPESFPVITSSGISGSINVGTPSNGIQNLCEFRGKILCLNVSNLFEVEVFNGVMYGPIQTPAQRGLMVRWAFCKGDNAVYYLGYDGIYSWDGGQSQKISEQIDPIFHPSAPAGLYPSMDQTANGLRFCTMEYFRAQVYFTYLDTTGVFWFLRYEPAYDRWTQETHVGVTGTVNPFFFAIYNEPDTNAFIFARTDSGGGVLSQNDQSSTTSPVILTGDEFASTLGNDGHPIAYAFQTAWFVPDSPIKVKLFLDVVLEYTSPNQDFFTLAVFYDYSLTPDATDTFIITPPNVGRNFTTLSLQISGSPAIASGKEAYAIGVKISGDATGPNIFHSLGVRYLDRDDVQLGIPTDWMNLGTNNDKRMYQMHLEHNTGGSAMTLHMDIRYGINGTIQANDVATFTVTSSEKTTVTLPIPEAGFPIPSGQSAHLTICKSIRLRPAHTTTNFRIFYKTTFDKEDLPPDLVLFTPWDDNSYPLNKYAQEVMIEADTAGAVVAVKIQADGTTVQTVNVQTTANDRHRNITLGPNLIGRQWRLFVDPTQSAITGGGKFQLFGCKWQFQNADKGPVNHTFDYDDLEWPYDKALSTVNFEFDTTSGGTFTVVMDTVTGIDGATLNVAAMTFPLPNTGRGKKTFAINPGTIVKLVRMYPQSDSVGSKQWGYKFNQTNYPADTVTFTEPVDFAYPCDKIARNLILDVDTGGVAATIQVQADGVNVQSFTVNTTYTSRSVILPFSSSPQPIGKTWRLLNTPGTGGKVQLFNWQIDFTKEPCAVNFWDSYEQAFGYDGFKFLKQVWLEYACTVPITLTILTDNAAIFYVATLPAHANRDVERFYLPDVVSTGLGLGTIDSTGLLLTWTAGTTFAASLRFISLDGIVYPISSVTNTTHIVLSTAAPPGVHLTATTVLNKSKIYRFQVASTTSAGFKFYLDGSRIEWAPLGSDQRGAYSQMRFSEAMKIPAEPSGLQGLLGA